MSTEPTEKDTTPTADSIPDPFPGQLEYLIDEIKRCEDDPRAFDPVTFGQACDEVQTVLLTIRERGRSLARVRAELLGSD